MKKSYKLGIAAASVALAGVGLFYSLTPRKPFSPLIPDSVRTEETGIERNGYESGIESGIGDKESRETLLPEALRMNESERYFLKGRVLNDYSKPVANAVVSAEYASFLRDESLDVSTETDSEGRFELQVGKKTLYDVFADAGFERGQKFNVVPRDDEVIYVSSLPSLQVNLLTNRNGQDEKYEEEADVILSSVSPKGIVREKERNDGKYVFPGLEVGAYDILVKVGDRPVAFVQDVPVPYRDLFFRDVTLEDLLDSKIKVVSEESKEPIRGVAINLSRSNFGLEEFLTTNSDGIAEISVFPGRYHAEFHRGGYVSNSASLVFSPDYPFQEIELGLAGVVNGIVKDKKGVPISGVSVGLYDAQFKTLTNERGEFSLTGLSKYFEDNDILFFKEAYQPELLEDFAVPLIGETLEVMLEDGIRVYGVVSASGDLVSNARIDVRRVGDRDKIALAFVENARVKTNSKGEYEFFGSTEKNAGYEIRVEAEGHAPNFFRFSLPDVPEFEYNLKLDSGLLSGTLRLERNGMPLKDVPVGVTRDARYWRDSDRFSLLTKTNERGEWTLENVGKGEYGVMASLASGNDQMWNVNAPSEGNDLFVNHYEVASINITNEKGHVQDATIKFYQESADTKPIYVRREILFSNDGFFQVFWPEGITELRVSVNGYKPVTVKDFSDIINIKLKKE